MLRNTWIVRRIVSSDKLSFYWVLNTDFVSRSVPRGRKQDQQWKLSRVLLSPCLIFSHQHSPILPGRLCLCSRLRAEAVQLAPGQPVSCCAISCSDSAAPHSHWQPFDSAVPAQCICHLPPFLSSCFLFFPDLDLCLTASSLFLFSENNESSLSCCYVLKPGSSFFAIKQLVILFEIQNSKPKEKVLLCIKFVLPQGLQTAQYYGLMSGLIFLNRATMWNPS